MVESFGPGVVGYCRFCYGTDDEADIQTHFHDSDFVARNHEAHAADVYSTQITNNKTYGVKSSNCFNTLKHFNVIDGFPPDCMHDFLEGTLPKSFGLLWNILAKKKLTSYAILSEKLNSFKYGRIDKKNKVPAIFTNRPDDSKKLSASHFWSFIRILPIIFGEDLKTDDFYNHFIDLIEIFFLINDYSFNEQKILTIEWESN